MSERERWDAVLVPSLVSPSGAASLTTSSSECSTGRTTCQVNRVKVRSVRKGESTIDFHQSEESSPMNRQRRIPRLSGLAVMSMVLSGCGADETPATGGPGGSGASPPTGTVIV